MTCRFTFISSVCCVLLLAVLFAVSGCEQKPSRPVDPADVAKAEGYLEVLEEYFQTAFDKGRDVYGEPTPIFVDGLNVETHEPVIWKYDHNRWVLANFANQQHLLRSLVGMTELTGDPLYKAEAVKTVEFAFDRLATPNGLFLWGGHIAYDARGDEWVGRRYHWLGKKRTPLHEMKANYPFYELMWEVDREGTRKFIRSFWENHVRSWESLDFDRHGGTIKPKTIDDSVWDRDFDEDFQPFFTGIGRTFVNCASDLFYAGVMLYELDGEKGALKWSERLLGKYDQIRHPETDLRGYQFTIPEIDRAQQQFGDQLPGKVVHEAYIFEPNALAAPLLTELEIYKILGKKGRKFRESAIRDLVSIADYGYSEETGRIRRMLLDGTDLTNVALPRNGYFGLEGQTVGDWPAEDYFIVLASALATMDFEKERETAEKLWALARTIVKQADVGDIGDFGGGNPALNADTDWCNPEFVIGFLELFEKTGNRAYLDQACVGADNLIEFRYENGLFMQEQKYKFTRLSRPESTALIHVAAELMGKRHLVPRYIDSAAFFACEQKSSDTSYIFDHNVIYPQVRDGWVEPEKAEPGTD